MYQYMGVIDGTQQKYFIDSALQAKKPKPLGKQVQEIEIDNRLNVQ